MPSLMVEERQSVSYEAPKQSFAWQLHPNKHSETAKAVSFFILFFYRHIIIVNKNFLIEDKPRKGKEL